MNDDRSHSPLLVPPSIQAWMQGVLSAKVVLVMYGDYQDLRSADVYKLIKRIKQELSAAFGEDYLCFVFRHFPQTQIHPHAQRATEVAEAAAAKGQLVVMNSNGKLVNQKLQPLQSFNELSQVPIRSNHQVRTHSLRQTPIPLSGLWTTVRRECDPSTD